MLTLHGQPRALAQLQRSLHSHRLASTWMFAGPAGVGKFTLAVELAKTVLCDHPQHRPNAQLDPPIPTLAGDFVVTLPCNACDSCRAVEHNNHPDLHIITKELIRYHDKSGTSKGTTLSIHVIRGEITGDAAENKEAKIYKRSFRGRGKFFIIDQADLMDIPAQNALLKTLEEPPPESYLILITASPQELLSTIRSRSQLIEFQGLPEEVIVKALLGTGLSRDEAGLLARLARGSLGRALAWAQDIRTIHEKNSAAAERADKKKAAAAPSDDTDDDGETSTNKFTPGGILAWTRELAALLDGLVSGQNNASEVAAAISKFAAEYSALQLTRDKLASADRAKRDGIQFLLSIAAEWFGDRLRHALGTPFPTVLPGESGALDYAVVPELIAAARQAEADVDMNVNDKILLAATTTSWEELLHGDTH